jgi:calcium/proton exchanger cax
VVAIGLLAIAFPAAVASHFFFPGTNTFVLCALTLIPLARFMRDATEVIAHRLGSGFGGLMNASFGNAAELAIAALREGQIEVVKASITGAILGNVMLVLRMAIVAGGPDERSRFQHAAALSGSAMMFLAIVAMTVADPPSPASASPTRVSARLRRLARISSKFASSGAGPWHEETGAHVVQLRALGPVIAGATACALKELRAPVRLVS